MVEVNEHRWNPGVVLLVLALALPMLSPWQWPPIVQFSNQLMSAGLWALTVLIWSGHGNADSHGSGEPRHWLAAFWLALAVALPFSLVLNERSILPAFLASGLVLLTLAVSLLVASLDPKRLEHFWRAFCIGLLLAGVGSALIVLLQVLLPAASARLGLLPAAEDGRASAHLLQPNHLASLILLAMTAAWTLAKRWTLGLGTLLFGLTLTLLATASRTGLVLACWLFAMMLGLEASTNRQRSLAWGLALLPGLAVLFYLLGLVELPESWRQRWLLWQDVLSLIAAKPWTGHGFGQLNAVWTLSPFPERPPDVFDHAHNLPLHLAVELGLPITTVLLTLLGVILWRGRRALRQRRGQAIAAMLAVLLVHSLVEYPLWYAYFLLPAAALLGMWVHPGEAAPVTKSRAVRYTCASLGLLSIVGLGLVIQDYQPIARLHERVKQTGTNGLAPWVERAQQSRWFGHLGDYAAIMLADDEARLEWFARPLAYRIDEPLLAAYARALVRAGREQEALAIIARAREFPPHPAWASLPRLPARPELKRE